MSIGIWEPLWLGPASRCLYAGLHQPASAAGSLGVLFVPPLLHELPRSRRFVAEVASGLAAQGLPCLRFDYFGTGDSAGSGDLVDFASMRVDISLAEAELRSRARVNRIVMLAWCGGALPLSSWVRDGAKPEKMVFWEPVVDGAEWLDRVQREDAAERFARRPSRFRPNGHAATNDDQLMGFDISPRMRQDLAEASNPWHAADWRVPTWALLRPDAQIPAPPWQRVFALPSDTPELGGAATVDATMFLSPRVARVVEELGHALLEDA